MIEIPVSGDLLEYCNDNLVLDNPDYMKKVKMGLWVGSTPKKIHLFSRDKEKLILPFGCIRDIWKYIKCIVDLELDFVLHKIKITEKQKFFYKSL
jgi:hypothetical protein